MFQSLNPAHWLPSSGSYKEKKIWYLYWTGYSSKLIPSGPPKSDTFIELVIPESWYQVGLKNLTPLLNWLFQEVDTKWVSKSDTFIELVIPASWYQVGFKNLLKSWFLIFCKSLIFWYFWFLIFDILLPTISITSVPRRSSCMRNTLRNISQVDLEGMFACGRKKTFAAPLRRLFHWHRGHYENMLRTSFQLLLSWAQHNY